MKTHILNSLICLSILSSCTEEELCLRGSGVVETHELETSAFESIYLYGPVNLRFRRSDTLNLSVVAEPETFRKLSYKIHDNSLFIGIEGNVSCFDTQYGVWMDVSLPQLNYINARGKNEILSDGPIYQDRIEIVTDGAAKLQLSGTVQEQRITVSGSLEAKTFDLRTERTLVKIDGGADLEVSCSDELNIDVKGSATIRYKGAPSITTKKDGSLSLQKMG